MQQYTQYIYKDNAWRELGSSGGGEGTVTEVAAGAGLNTTSNDASVDGGTITSTGTLYLTKSGVAAGTYQGITVDKYGRVTSASDQGYTTNTGTITKVQANGTDVASSGTANIPAASTSAYGVTELSSATDSTSEALAATPKAVKAAYDLAASKGTGTITGVSVNGTSVATSGVANITSMPASILSGAIPSAVTATTQSQGDNSTKIATTAYVDTAIDNLPDPMVFKGSLGTGGTITALPVDGSASIGDTYKVITAGTYASKAAKVGDTFICLTKTSSANTWELIPSGDEPSGTVTSITINATSPIAIDSSSAITTSGERTISHANSGVTAGTYRSVTVNATGHVTAGTNPTTISGYGITDAKIASGVITLGSNTITPLTAHQSAFSNVKVGSTTVAADQAGDTLELEAGSNITLTPDATNDKVTISATDTNTTYTLGADTTNNKITLTPSSGNAQSVTVPYATSAGNASTVNNLTVQTAVPANAVFTDTTYESKTAASGGTDLSLVTTGEKYTWNNKSDASNLKNGSRTGSLRSVSSATEDSNYTIGSYAFAEGYGTKATSIYSHAEGCSTTTSGNSSHAEGYNTTASGDYSHSEGNNTSASGSYAHVEGYYSKANSNASHAEGDTTWAIGKHTHTEGGTSSGNDVVGTITALNESTLSVTVTGLPTFESYKNHLCSATTTFSGDKYITTGATGSFTVSKWDSNFAVNGNFYIRLRNIAEGDDSHAEGRQTVAYGQYSHAEGIGTYAKANGQHVQGKWNVINNSYLDIVGNGTGPDARSNAYTLDASGNGIYAGKLTVGTGPENDMDVATKQYADSVGTTNLNIKNGSSSQSVRTAGAQTESSSYTIGIQAFAEGQQTAASGRASHAEGSYSKATNTAAHAEGNQCEASGSSSHAEGYETKATNSSAHAEGSGSVASGSYAHAEGYRSIAEGTYAHAEGRGSYAYNQASHAEGYTFDSAASGTIVTIDQDNLTVTVSGLPTYSYYKYQLYDNSNSFYGDQYISSVSGPSSGVYTFVLSKWDSSLAVGGTFNIGLRSTALGYGSHAEGAGTLAGNYWGTHAEGKGTIAVGEAQHAEGKWNVINSNMAHIVGNGTDFTNRSNAYTLDWNGNGTYAGKVTVGAAPTNNMDVATKQYVDALMSSGSNTNGNYFRIGNIQICTHSIDVAKTGSSNFGSGTTYYGSGSWTYPQAFTEVWTVQVSAADTASGLFAASLGANPTTSSCSIEWMGSNLSSGSIPVKCFAIGKWQ